MQATFDRVDLIRMHGRCRVCSVGVAAEGPAQLPLSGCPAAAAAATGPADKQSVAVFMSRRWISAHVRKLISSLCLNVGSNAGVKCGPGPGPLPPVHGRVPLIHVAGVVTTGSPSDGTFITVTLWLD